MFILIGESLSSRQLVGQKILTVFSVEIRTENTSLLDFITDNRMAKYIDAALLKAMMQLEYNKNKALFKKTGEKYVEGIIDGLDIVEQFIASLQQEQSCDTCTNDKGCVTCKDGELWEGKEQPSEDLEGEIDAWYNTKGIPVSPDALKDTARHFYELGKQSKEPVNEDLEAEIKRYRKEEMPVVLESDLNDIARHFANWQKEQMIRDCSVQASYEAEIEKAEERGYNLCKQQMLKDAVEASVNYYENIPGGSYVELVADILNPTGVRYKDKVKIIIVKEDKK